MTEPPAPEAPGSEPAATPAPSTLGRVLRPRVRRVDVAVALLLGVLGFAAVVQVRSTQEGPLAGARQEDLVTILDDLANRNDRLRAEIDSLNRTRERLTTGTGRSEAALAEARRRAQVLGVLAGTVPARGPGIVLTLADPERLLTAEALLSALQELRDAGAEAMQLEGDGGAAVRVVASTALVDGAEGGVVVDGTLLQPPYRFVVIGDPQTIAAAVGIPGGVVDDVEQRGGTATVDTRDGVVVSALRPLAPPRYARPAPAE